LYGKFINWVSGQFELYLQDKLYGLKTFYPSGYFYITETDKSNNIVNFKIIVRNNYKKKRGALSRDLSQQYNLYS